MCTDSGSAYLRDHVTYIYQTGEVFDIYDSFTEVNELTWYFSTESKKNFDKRRFYMRMYFPSKMNQILIDAGFKICHQWGDYYRTNINEGSTLQIYDVQIVS